MTITISKRAIFCITIFILLGAGTMALAKDKVVFPVAELGGCEDKKACHIYCEKPENKDVCFEFAKKYGLLEGKAITQIEKIKKAMDEGGPGNCRTEDECEKYCGKVERLKECHSFAKKHGLRPERELKEMEKVAQALEQGMALPGGCQDKESCDAYCEDTERIDECIDFAKKAGLMDEKEIKEAEKFIPLMKKGKTPGGCKSKKQCELYCDKEENFEECISFAEGEGLIPKEEAEMARKTGGKGPGGCRGKFECDSFCEKSENQEACFEFGVEHGMIPPEEVEMIKKVGFGGGPGGCRGKDECDAFCGNPENQEICFEFAVEKGLISPEEMEEIKEMGGPKAFKGPGGCMGPEECEAYCSDEENMEECMQFGGPEGERGGDEEELSREDWESGDRPRFGGPKYIGPGGCQSPKECSEFCRKPENAEECGNFIPETPEDVEMPPPRRDCPVIMLECGEDQVICKRYNEEGCPMTECLPAGSECEPQSGPPAREPRCPLALMVLCKEGEIMCRLIDSNGCPTTSCISQKEQCPKGDFPGRRDDFGPPPGFGQEPPGREEFEVSPGFVPPGRQERERPDGFGEFLDEARLEGGEFEGNAESRREFEGLMNDFQQAPSEFGIERGPKMEPAPMMEQRPKMESAPMMQQAPRMEPAPMMQEVQPRMENAPLPNGGGETRPMGILRKALSALMMTVER